MPCLVHTHACFVHLLTPCTRCCLLLARGRKSAAPPQVLFQLIICLLTPGSIFATALCSTDWWTTDVCRLDVPVLPLKLHSASKQVRGLVRLTGHDCMLYELIDASESKQVTRCVSSSRPCLYNTFPLLHCGLWLSIPRKQLKTCGLVTTVRWLTHCS